MNLADLIQIGKYPVIREIASGATSRVFLARDPFTAREVAIKLVYPDPRGNSELSKRFQKMFLNEASLAGKLSHPHIVQIFDAVAESHFGYIVMEYVAGGTLEPYCDVSQLLALRQVAEIAFKCTRALEFAQRNGVIHRDIKPANILVRSGSDIKITDFGAALLELEDQTAISGIGSPAYMSPEQVQDLPLTHHTDIYSLGVVMYQLLTGRLPFSASNNVSLVYQIINIDPPPPSTHRREIPPELDAIVMKAMAKNPAQRFASWQEFGAALTAALGSTARGAESLSDVEQFATVRNLPFFADFSDVELWEALRIASWHRIPAGTVVIREGEQGDSFYVVTAGEVEVTREGTLLNILRPGDCFGEMLYFRSATARRTTTIRTLGEVTVMEIKAFGLNQASDACQVQFNRAFLAILIDRLSLAHARLAGA